jgi:hypothetical protein
MLFMHQALTVRKRRQRSMGWNIFRSHPGKDASSIPAVASLRKESYEHLQRCLCILLRLQMFKIGRRL